MAKITRVTITEFSFDVPDIGLQAAAAGVGNMAYVKGSVFRPRRFAVKIDTDEGVSGGYVANWVGTPSAMAQAGMLAPMMVGRDPMHREKIWDDQKREIRAYDHMGHGVLDIALWDLCGRLGGVSVKSRNARRRASTASRSTAGRTATWRGNARTCAPSAPA